MADRPSSAEQSLTEFFQCHICYERIKNPHLCPHCSKPCCFECYKRWLMTEQPNCPFCRAHLLTHELVKCRWLKEIIDQLDQVLAPRSRREGDERDRCPTHNERLSVFCKTCLRCICSNCALFGGQHAGHDFAQVDEIYQQHLQSLVAQANSLRQHLVDIARQAKKVDKAMEHVHHEREKHEQMTSLALEHVMQRLERGATEKMRQLSEVREKMNGGGESISRYLVELEKKISSSSKSDIITQAYMIKQKGLPFLQDVNEQDLSKIARFTNEIVPAYEPKSFKLEKFSVARQRGEVVYSAPLRVGGLTWRLKVYPDGCNNVGRGKYLSVFLELKEGFAKNTTYEYRIQLLWQGGRDASKDLVREHASEFALGESWGYNKFCRLDYLLPDGYLHPVHDTLQFRFGVRCQTYYQQCKDLGLYVHGLERQKSNMVRRIRHLEQKLKHEVNRNRSRGPPPDDTRSQSTMRTPDNRRGSYDLEDETSVTSPSHHTEEEEDHPSSWTPPQPPEHSDTVGHSRTSNQRQLTQRRRNSDEAAAGSSGLVPPSQLREKSKSVQDMKSLQVYQQHFSPIEEQQSNDRTPEYIGPQEPGWRRGNWEPGTTEHHAHQRSQSADSTHFGPAAPMPHSSKSTTMPQSSQTPLAHTSQRKPHSSSSTEVWESEPSRTEHPWGTLHPPQAPWSEGYGYDTAETSQHSPVAAPDTAFWGEQPPPSNSRLNFMSELSQNRQSQSPTEHLRHTVDHQDIAIHVHGPEFSNSGNSCSPRDSAGYPQGVPPPYVHLSQQYTQEDEWVGTNAPPHRQKKRDGGHAHQPHKLGNLSRMASEPYLGPPGLKSSVAAALAQEIPPPPLTQYCDSQSQQHNHYLDSTLVDGRERHTASQMSMGTPGGKKHYRRAKARHHRSQERL